MPRHEPVRTSRPRLEGLEERVALSVVSASLQNGTLVMQCNNAMSRAGVVKSDGYIFAADQTNKFVKKFPAAQVRSVRFLGGEGNDCFQNNVAGLPSVAYGKGGSDSLRGNSGVDRFFGGKGVDYLNGMGGKDELRGEGDGDFIYGGIGDDRIWGGDGGDRIYGQSGKDQIDGGDMTDWIYGGTENDILHGGDGDDYLFGESGDDDLYGEGDNDWLEAGSAEETAIGGDGDQDWNAHIWVYGGTTIDDTFQPVGTTTCSFLATLAGVNAHGQNLKDRIRYLGNFRYGVRMFNGASWVEQEVTFTGYLYNDDPTFNTESESYAILLQRAYLDMYGSGYRIPNNAIQALTGATAVQVELAAPPATLLDDMAAALAAGRTVVACTPSVRTTPYTGQPLQIDHSYTILGFVTDAFGSPTHVQVRDPGGFYQTLTVQDFYDGFVAVFH
ncbi:MAG: calcium-binding protein [Gemmataceae bacterium]